MELLGGGAVSYERGTPVLKTLTGLRFVLITDPAVSSAFSLLLSSLELSDTKVYEP